MLKLSVCSCCWKDGRREAELVEPTTRGHTEATDAWRCPSVDFVFGWMHCFLSVHWSRLPKARIRTRMSLSVRFVGMAICRHDSHWTERVKHESPWL